MIFLSIDITAGANQHVSLSAFFSHWCRRKKKNQSSIQRTIGKEIKQNSRVNAAKFVISEIKAQTSIILFF